MAIDNEAQAESRADGAPRPPFFSRLFWAALACVNIVAVAWIGWLLWQITPRPVVTDLAYQSQRFRPHEPRPGPSDSGVPALSADSPIRTGAPIDTLKLETELRGRPATPAQEERARVSGESGRASK